jgi:uncharacterized coiled-coil protein SlyX
MTKEEILRRIEVENTRIANAQRNLTGLTKQISNSQDTITSLQALLEALPAE